MKNKKVLISVIIGILLIFSFIIFNKTLKNKTATKLNESKWEIYENKEYGYRFKYPSDAKVMDGKNYPSSFGKEKSTLIFLPEKYESLKNPQYIDKDEIHIQFVRNKNKLDETTDEIINQFSGKTTLLKQTITEQGNIVLVYSLGQVYIIDKDSIYSIHLLRQDPSVFTQDWLSEDQIIKLKDNYTNEISILEDVYLSFKIIY